MGAKVFQYLFYEQSHAAVAPARAASEAMRLLVTNPLSPLSYTFHSRAFAEIRLPASSRGFSSHPQGEIRSEAAKAAVIILGVSHA